jgi:signal transduction histidine kinase
LEAVGRLAAGLAHDFNNTLLVVSGFAELIDTEQGVTGTVRANVEEIRIAVAKASKMVGQLFSIGRAPVKTKACIDVNGVLREAESSLRQHLRAGQSLVLSLAEGNPIVDVGASQMDQVVRNLVLNARDAMPDGGTITITTRSGDGSTSPRGAVPVLLEIRDTGKGMDAATRAMIFEPFFTTKALGEGTGLGLSMVQMIVEAAGGTIEVDSAPGSGTLFRIVLPSAASSETPGRRNLPDHTTGGAP